MHLQVRSHSEVLGVKASLQFRSITQSCPTLCDPMECSTRGLPVHHQLPLTQTHVNWVGLQRINFGDDTVKPQKIVIHVTIFFWAPATTQIPNWALETPDTFSLCPAGTGIYISQMLLRPDLCFLLIILWCISTQGWNMHFPDLGAAPPWTFLTPSHGSYCAVWPCDSFNSHILDVMHINNFKTPLFRNITHSWKGTHLSQLWWDG